MKNLDELKELSKPLAEYLKEHYNPHTTITIIQDKVKIVAGDMGVTIWEYL